MAATGFSTADALLSEMNGDIICTLCSASSPENDKTALGANMRFYRYPSRSPVGSWRGSFHLPSEPAAADDGPTFDEMARLLGRCLAFSYKHSDPIVVRCEGREASAEFYELLLATAREARHRLHEELTSRNIATLEGAAGVR